MKTTTVALDILSGGQNPWIELSLEEWQHIQQWIEEANPIESVSFFDGLGFRGFVLDVADELVVCVQQQYLKIEQYNQAPIYKATKRALLLYLFELFEEACAQTPHYELLEVAKASYAIA